MDPLTLNPEFNSRNGRKKKIVKPMTDDQVKSSVENFLKSGGKITKVDSVQPLYNSEVYRSGSAKSVAELI
jgi:hypothetical protein